MTRLATLLISALIAIPLVAHGTVRFVALPDTQIYSDNRFPPGSGSTPVTDPLGTYRYFVDQTQWIADNADTLGIDFVVHLGDIVQSDDNLDEWTRAKAALDILDTAGVPYGTVLGNHDAHELSDGRPYYDMFVQDYGPQHFTGMPWYGGASPTGASSYQIVGDGTHDVLFLNLAIAAPAVELAWADGVLSANRDKLVVLTTHAYMYDVFGAAGRYGEPLGPFTNIAGDGRFDQFHDGAGKSSQQIFLELIRSHPNIVMAQGGHFDADLYRLSSINGAGLPVLEIVSDYQGLLNGGNGYLRLYEIDFDADQIRVDTYSPTLDRHRTTFEHFVDAIWFLWKFRDEVADALGISESEAFGLLALLYKNDAVPGVDVVSQNPEYLADPTFYDQHFLEIFRGTVPPEVGSLSDWETLWVNFFAADPDNPSDYSPAARSPGFTVDMELDRYTDTTLPTRKQRACIAKLATQPRLLMRKRGRHTVRCLRDSAKGKLSNSVDECIEDEVSSAVERIENKTAQIEAEQCTAPEEQPAFGITNAPAINQAAKSSSIGMTNDLLGPAPRQVAAPQDNRDAFNCQTKVAVRTHTLLEGMLRAALKQLKKDLATDSANNADLTRGMLETIDADPNGIVARFRARLADRIGHHCHDAGIDVATHLPGTCTGSAGAATDLADCLATRARCRVCRAMNEVHGSALSCDYFDDGDSINLSCP